MAKNLPKSTEDVVQNKISPSRFMRELRPEYYSDTQDRVGYRLDTATFDHHLDTITDRNQTHDFELFARKLCERTICPNLRPQTGPEGGGDSKADTETYPVADEISRFYCGDASGGKERWAFAFSAKKTWGDKARRDVKGIVETGRAYDRIICVTSRFARAKDRARVEDELSKAYGIPVTIHDRSWIIKEVIENDRKDIAHNYLGIGEVSSDPLRLGPTDYSRMQQLAAIEKSLDDPAAFGGMELQRVTEALLAAKLSRNLERPRTETDGSFSRAIRLAEADGTFRQKLEAHYESIWTAFWWFDDFELVNKSYDAFAERALPSDFAANLEFVCNLLQLLVNSVIHGHLTREQAKLDERTVALRSALEAVAENVARPNNSLEARTSLLIMRLNAVMVDGKRDDLPVIWREFGEVLDRASGLGEFDAERAEKMIEIAGNVAGNDPAYNELVENLADFVAKRTSQAKGALILLKRANQLEFSDRIDMIRLLGKAASGLSKKEHQDSFIEALHHLTLAYKSAGLLWAARSSCVMAAASVVVQGEEDSQIPAVIVPTLKIWAWISVQLRHLPDLLFAIQLMNGALAGLPLTDQSKERLKQDLTELDCALGCVLINLSDAELAELQELPDVLEALGLFMARSAFLYTLGYSDQLREDGSIPKQESDEDVNRLYSTLASQPLNQQTRGPLILNGQGPQQLVATVLGMSLEISFEGSDRNTVVAESILAAVEAFLATTIDQHVFPHTEKFRIALQDSDEAAAPEIEPNPLDMSITVKWPTGLAMADFGRQQNIGQSLFAIAGHVLGMACMVRDFKGLLDKMHEDEAVHQRLGMVTAAPNSYHRVASKGLSRLPDWQAAVRKSYPALETRPKLEKLKFDARGGDDDEDEPDPWELRSHQEMGVLSVIDVHAWDQANWTGAFYFRAGPDGPPCLALVFNKEVATRKIFERWRERFGDRDRNEAIYLAVIRKLPKTNPSHYVMLITSKRPDIGEREAHTSFIVSTRSMTMTPDTTRNLDQFLEMYLEFGGYYLLPAVMKNGQPEILRDLGIVKRHLSIKDASDVEEHDIEAIALRQRALDEESDDKFG